MPLRSVEAATRDDAIAAAREQFGLTARVVGVRRVRSGGMLGFFATERYVAEVDPHPQPPVPLPPPATRERRAVQDPVRESARESAREAARQWTDGTTDGAAARRSVPARNAAAAWAAEARPPVRPPAAPAAEEARVDELAGLLRGAPEPAPYVPAASPRPARTPGPETRPTAGRMPAPRPAWSELLAGTGPQPVPAPAPVAAPTRPEPPVGPSPFTAALARMVAGDRDVQQAVEDAVSPPGEELAPDMPPARPTWPDPQSPAETSVPSPGTHQEEEPVELQDWTPSSPPVIDPPAGWAPAPAPLATREESIAEVLRTALAEGRSDEALAGILRTVMDGASTAAALAEPPAPVAVEPEAPQAPELFTVEPVAVEPVAVEPVAVEPVAVEPVAVEALPVEPVVEAVVALAPVPEPEDVLPAPIEERTELFPAVTVQPEPAAAPIPSGSDLGWADAETSSLWAETVVPATRTAPVEEPVAAPVLEEPVAEVEPVDAAVLDLFADEVPEVAVAEAVVEEPVVEEAVVEEPVAEQAVVEEPVAEQAVAEEPVVERALVEQAGTETVADETADEEAAVLVDQVAPVLARTASDHAPLPLDATTVMPPLSLLPPLPSRPRSGRPPVPPSTGRASSAPAGPAAEPPAVAGLRAPGRSDHLATVTRLPLAPVTPAPVRRPAGAPQPGILDRLASLGLAEELLDGAFTADLAARGTYAALTRLLAARLPETPAVPAGAGDVLVVVGPGVETLRAARALAASLRLDPDRVQWATRGDLAGLAPAGSRMTTIEGAIDRRHEAVGSGTLTIVAVDAPLRTDAFWTAQMLAIWSPDAVWAVVEATRKPEDLRPWLVGLPRVDALVVQDTDLSADPAAVLDRVALPLRIPVAVVDGIRATPHRWASLLCERLETPQA